jgi:hypothetical protein
LTEEQDISIHPAELIGLHQIAFKLVPLGNDSKPVMQWTPIYEDPNYWTPDKLVREASMFKNGVATVFGETRLKDEKGRSLNLYCLDIDSNGAYNILSRLQNPNGGKEYSLIPLMQERTFVVKTRKPNGFHLYWLSSKQHKPILTSYCKSGYEFEIKGGKSSGHSTLPPTKHREDPNFHYKEYGQKILWIADNLYDRLVDALSDCLIKDSSENSEKEKSYHNQRVELSDEDVQSIVHNKCAKWIAQHTYPRISRSFTG